MIVFNLLAIPKSNSEHEGVFLMDTHSLEEAKNVQKRSSLVGHHFWIEENIQDAKGDEVNLRFYVLLHGQTNWEEVSLREWTTYTFPET